MASTGNATDFGNLSVARVIPATFGSSITCIPLCGGTVTNTIDYVQFNTLGNSSDFGDATVARRAAGGLSNDTRG